MKKILFLSLVLTAVATGGYAHGEDTAKPKKETKESTKPAAGTKAGSSGDVSVIYLGTNEFYLALEREGVQLG